jgi:hypothetical protein
MRGGLAQAAGRCAAELKSGSLAEAVGQDFGEARGPRRLVARDADFQLQAGTVGHGQVGAARRAGHDLGRHDQLLGALDQGLVALALEHALALDVGQPLGQGRRDQDTEQQGDEDTARHRADKGFHAAGSTVTWPAST